MDWMNLVAAGVGMAEDRSCLAMSCNASISNACAFCQGAGGVATPIGMRPTWG